MQKKPYLKYLPLLLSLLMVQVGGGVVDVNYNIPPPEGHGYYFAAYTLMDSPLKLFNYGEAFVQYNLTWSWDSLPLRNFSGDMISGEVLVYHGTLRDKIGSDYSIWTGERNYCCTTSLYAAGACSRLGGMNFNVSEDPAVNGNYLFYKSVKFQDYQDNTASLSDFHKIEHTGLWYIAMANCDENNENGIMLNVVGLVVFKNPFGYLGGESLGFLFLYWIFSALYITMGAMWAISSYYYNKDMVIMQHIIAFVIGISICENLLWAGDYILYNANGDVHPIANIFGALLSSTKLTIVRLLVLLVALGFKIVCPTLEQKPKMAIIVLMIFYFFVAASQEYITIAEASGEEIQNGLQATILALLAISETIVFSWIGISLMQLIHNQQLINQPTKYSMYHSLIILLIASVSFSFLIALSQLVIQISGNIDDHWWFLWLFGGYWEFIYIVSIAFIAWMWRPSGENMRYAYVEVPEDEKDIKLDEDGMENGTEMEVFDRTE